MNEQMETFAAMMANKYGIRKPETPAPAPEPKVEITRTKPNRAENFFMMDLMILKNSLAIRMDAVRDRLSKANKNAWRDLKLLCSLVTRIQNQLIETMPESRWDYYSTLARSGRYHLDIEGPVRQGRMVLISDIHLAQLCESVIEAECTMCLRCGGEIDKCPVRQALLEVAPPTEILDDRCEYRNVAGQLLNGKDVTI